MKELALEFLRSDSWLEMIMFLELHPEARSDRFKHVVASCEDGAEADDWPGRIAYGTTMVEFASRWGVADLYEIVARMRYGVGFDEEYEPTAQDYQEWLEDIRRIEVMANRYEPAYHHLACAYRTALEIPLIPRCWHAEAANAMARWAAAESSTVPRPDVEEYRRILEGFDTAEGLAKHSMDSDVLAKVEFFNADVLYKGFLWGYDSDLSDCMAKYTSALTHIAAPTTRAGIRIGYGQVLLSNYMRHDASNVETAIELLQEALDMAGNIGEVRQITTILTLLARAYGVRQSGKRASNMTESVDYYRHACGLHEMMEDTVNEGRTAIDLGHALVQLETEKALGEARDIFRMWQDLFDEDLYPYEAARINEGLGLLESLVPSALRDDPFKELEYYRQAQRLFEVAGRDDYRGAMLVSIGRFYCETTTGDRAANLRLASSYYERAIPLMEGRDLGGLGAALHNLGVSYIDQPAGDRSTHNHEAKRVLERALSIRTRERFPLRYCDTLEALSGVLAHLTPGGTGPLQEQAIEHFRETLDIRTHLDSPLPIASTKEKLASALADSHEHRDLLRLRESLRLFAEAMAEYRQRGETAKLAHALVNQAQAFEDVDHVVGGFRDKAISAYEEALQHYDRSTYPVERRKAL